ncbi:uncharacterized protein LOC131156773 [Malania oleifera]|uniref:uncharacterized protein LOC131156773 n=1 Tax=Malania oleifera TaxID=397392 RepID=UPI0025AE91DE|nr:uncharacterized protein LOC131156773 [Malania oleifera]
MVSFPCCSLKFLPIFLLISAVPVAFIVSQERGKPATHVYHYRSQGWLRECAKWDDQGRRFLVSFMEGGLGQIPLPLDHSPETALDEITVVKDADVAGNSTLGLTVDRPRNRVVVAIADVIRNTYSAVAAYDLDTWNRLFLTRLSSPGEKSFADDVAVDPEGNAYVTDVKNNRIWKVGPEGQLQSIIQSPLFSPKQWYKSFIGLNGIVYHPDGFLLVIHTSSGDLFKIGLGEGDQRDVNLVEVEGTLSFGDGIELLSPTKLVVAAGPPRPTATLVESSDGWKTATVVGKFVGPVHRVATATTVKDGKAYVSHLVGLGYPAKKHALVEAVFTK